MRAVFALRLLDHAVCQRGRPCNHKTADKNETQKDKHSPGLALTVRERETERERDTHTHTQRERQRDRERQREIVQPVGLS